MSGLSDLLNSHRSIRKYKTEEIAPALQGLKEINEANGIQSLAEFFTRTLKYDPDELETDWEKLQAILIKKGFLRPPNIYYFEAGSDVKSKKHPSRKAWVFDLVFSKLTSVVFDDLLLLEELREVFSLRK